MNPVFEGKVRTPAPRDFRTKESRLQAKGFCWHFAGAKFVDDDPSKRIKLSSVIPQGGNIAGICVRADAIGKRMILAKTIAEFESFPGKYYTSATALLTAYRGFLRDRAADIAKEESEFQHEVRLNEKQARLAAGDPRGHNRPVSIKIRVNDGADFKAKERPLLNVGGAWVFDGKVLKAGVKSRYPVPGTSQDPYGIFIVFRPMTGKLRLSIIHDKRHWDDLKCQEEPNAPRLSWPSAMHRPRAGAR